jgi:hypothetical protein
MHLRRALPAGSLTLMVRTVVRAILALLLIVTFGARVAAPGASWACTMPQGSGHGAHGHHAGSHPHPDPGESASQCECLTHSATFANFSAPPRHVPGRESVRVVSIPADAARPPAALPAHLLPFAHAPPAPLG